MDGFYVCKIQKLSDKMPGESKKGEAVKEEEAVVVKPKCYTETREAAGKLNSGKGKKRAIFEEQQGPAKDNKISVPPSKQRQKKRKKMNAKMSKPRRVKADKII